MKIFAPKYYKDFKCAASNCTHSCCIGWEIDVDENTLLKYSNLTSGYGKQINESITPLPTPHFALAKNGNCVHLDENGLCKIICNLGEEYLCEICKEHPRFYNQTPFGLEVGLGLSCEEACRIILTSNNYNEFEEVDECDLELEKLTFNPIPERNEILSILSTRSPSYSEKLKILQSRYSVSPSVITDEDWHDVLNSLEYLNDKNKLLFSNYSSTIDKNSQLDAYLEKALAYFVFRYLSKAQNQAEIKQYLGLCLFLERLLNSALRANSALSLSQAIQTAIIVSEEIEYNEDNLDAILFEFI